MAKNPLIIPKDKSKINFVDLPKSAGILDDYAIRKNVATKEGTIEKVPVNDSDIVNKKYVNDFWDSKTTDDVSEGSKNLYSIWEINSSDEAELKNPNDIKIGEDFKFYYD